MPKNPITVQARIEKTKHVVVIFLQHTGYILMFCGGIWLIGQALKFMGMDHKLLPIPFFPAPVPLDDALFLLDFIFLVLFYFIAFKEIAELYEIKMPDVWFTRAIFGRR